MGRAPERGDGPEGAEFAQGPGRADLDDERAAGKEALEEPVDGVGVGQKRGGGDRGFEGPRKVEAFLEAGGERGAIIYGEAGGVKAEPEKRGLGVWRGGLVAGGGGS